MMNRIVISRSVRTVPSLYNLASSSSSLSSSSQWRSRSSPIVVTHSSMTSTRSSSHSLLQPYRPFTSTFVLHSTPVDAKEKSEDKKEDAKDDSSKDDAKKDGEPGFFRSESWTKTVGTIGAVANWAIPLAAITHMMSEKDPATTIDPVMTSALAIYSLFFMRWAIAVSPANYPLLLCHISNECVQVAQLIRYAKANAALDEKKAIKK